jgi:hypothetical protein
VEVVITGIVTAYERVVAGFRAAVTRVVHHFLGA